MTPNSSLENLEFFDSFSVDDPIDLDTAVEDPNANIKPDILGGVLLLLQKRKKRKKR